MAYKGSKLNFPYLLFISLEKMAYAIQNTVGDQDKSLFHHGFFKIVILYQLSYVGRNWDEFLSENKFGKTQYWPYPLPKVQ